MDRYQAKKEQQKPKDHVLISSTHQITWLDKHGKKMAKAKK